MLGPILLIVIGILFLLRNIYPYLGFDKMWPVILIVIGLAKVFEYFQGHPEKQEEKMSGANASPTGRSHKQEEGQ